MPTDTNVDNLIINVLTEEQYEEIQNPSSTELYLVPDVIDDTPTEDSPNPVSSGGVYNAINNAKEIYWCYWDDANSTVTGLTPAEIYQLTMNGCVVKCMYVESETYVFDLARVALFAEDTYEVVFKSPVSVDSSEVVNYGIFYYVDGTWEYISYEFTQTQSDWNQTNVTAVDYIKNKPKISIFPSDGYYFPNVVQDYDGNWYGAVVIGDQVWLAENLRTKHYYNGDDIEYDYVANNPSNYEEYGLIYSFNAIMNQEEPSNTNPSNVVGISPTGFHLPSVAEFTQLCNYVSNKQELINDGSVSKALAIEGDIWNTSSVNKTIGFEKNKNNTTGFSAKPNGSKGLPSGRACSFNTCTEDGSDSAKFQLVNDTKTQSIFYSLKMNKHAVRCVSDLNPIQFRNWYIEQYGSLQHHLSDNEYITTTDGTATGSTETITFTGIRRCQVFNFDSGTVSGTLDITVEIDGYGENQILLNNGNGGNVAVTFSAVVLNDTSLSGSNIYVPSSPIEVEDGKSMLVNVLCYHTSSGDKAVITVSDTLEPLT